MLLHASPVKVAARGRARGTPAVLTELDRYLHEPRESSVANIIDWWYSHRAEYPNLYQMALDYCSVPGGSIVHHFSVNTNATTQELPLMWSVSSVGVASASPICAIASLPRQPMRHCVSSHGSRLALSLMRCSLLSCASY